MTYSIRKYDIDKAACILSQSFIDYPIFNYIIPDGAYRKRKLKYLFKFLICLGLANGEVISTSKGLECISIWIHSPKNKISLITVLQSGLLSLCFHVNLGVLFRLIKIGAVKQNTQNKIIAEHYCLLDMIGVDPIFQKNGYGRRMIEEKLIELDNSKIPCYLETSKIENVAYYAKLGFKLIHEYKIINIKVFCLLR